MFAANSDGRARLALAIALTILPTAGALAHGFAGSRFFPATITIDDPFVADELSLPTVSNQKTGTDPSVVQTDTRCELSKPITSDFGFSIGYAWSHLDQAGPPHNPNGFHNLEITPRYQFLLNAPHEAVASVGVITEVGGTGAKRVGAVPFATYTPTFYFGKWGGRSAGIVELGAPVRGDRNFWLQHYVQQEDHEPGCRSRHRVHHARRRPFFERAKLWNRGGVQQFLFACQYSRFWLARMGESTDPTSRIQVHHAGYRPIWRENRRDDQPWDDLVRPGYAVRCRGDYSGNKSHREKRRHHRPAAFLPR